MLQKWLSGSLIRSAASVLLAFVFALAISPKQVLHCVFANHIDGTANNESSSTEHITLDSFHCGCDSPVVDTAFAVTFGVFQHTEVSSYNKVYLPAKQKVVDLPSHGILLRGPPVFA